MKRIRDLLTLILALIFAGSTAMVLWLNTAYQDAAQTYEDAQALAYSQADAQPFPPAPQLLRQTVQDIPVKAITPTIGAPVTQATHVLAAAAEALIYAPGAEHLMSVDLAALREVNTDVIGWIFLPGTNINYPLLQSGDNQHYLNYTWEGKYSSAGSIFMECNNRSDFSDFNTILYGHNLLGNGAMFSQLMNYKTQAFWEENPYIYIAVESGVYRYEIFAAYEAPVNSATYWLGIDTDALKQQFISSCVARSIFDTGITPDTADSILTLSTCNGRYTYDTRWVVQARLEGRITDLAQMIPQEQ